MSYAAGVAEQYGKFACVVTGGYITSCYTAVNKYVPTTFFQCLENESTSYHVWFGMECTSLIYTGRIDA